MTIVDLSRALADQKITSRQLVEQALAAIRDPLKEGARAFLLVHENEALAAADRVDAQRRSGAKLPALAGIPISIKDLFDEAGSPRSAARRCWSAPAATRDSTVVERLRKAGAVIIGRTNMTEFAYSGLGINPHYGTPRNAFDRPPAAFPAARRRARGVGHRRHGRRRDRTDTGGSVRIPAALNGLVGFKPTARRVPLDGVLPLSITLDSAGPIAKTVADCALLDRCWPPKPTVFQRTRLRGLRFAVPKTVFQDDLSPAVANAFTAALGRLSAAGATIIELPMAEFAQAAAVNPRGALTSAEAFVASAMDEGRGR